MARVKINSKINTQPATNGFTKKNRMGLIIRKLTMVSLNQAGELPRKLSTKASFTDAVIFMYSLILWPNKDINSNDNWSTLLANPVYFGTVYYYG